MSVGIVRDPLYLEHSNGAGHPERAERLMVIDDMLGDFDRRAELTEITPRDASEEQLLWVHTPEHLHAVAASRGEGFTMFTLDTFATSRTYEAALRAAGGAVSAVEAVMGGVCDSALALLRPPGHHAERNGAMGFCFFNNVAVAAEYGMRVEGADRVLILDWDVHHGNGTMHSFYGSPHVLYQSIHQFPHYPGTGEVSEIGSGEGKGYNVGVPLGGGQHDEDYLYVFERLFMPLAAEFAPQLILVSAGFDCDGRDPLSSMSLSAEAFGCMTAAIIETAATCSAPVVICLEGGYDLGALREGVEHVIRALLGTPYAWKDAQPGSSRPVVRVVREAAEVLSPYWRCLAG
jgi:acetoin utilization deacetylase AcuC-like enzyme